MNLATPITAKQIERHTILDIIEVGRQLAQDEGRDGTISDAVWALVCEAILTDQSLPDRYKSLLRNAVKAFWPLETTMTQAEQDQRKNDRVQSNMSPYDEVTIAHIPTAAAIDRHEIVFRWFRYWRSINKKRDWQVIVMLARKTAPHIIKGRSGLESRQAVHRVRTRLVGNILEGLKGRYTIC